METLSVGMYVRTLNGIVKIDKIKDSIMIDTKGKTHFGDFIKASYNITDILEERDYVNGYPIYEIVEYEDDTRAIVIDDDNKSIIWESKDIKSVITHEQMEQIEYKVEE